MTPSATEMPDHIQTIDTDDIFNNLAPGEEDDDIEGDWNDEDDEVFDDLAEDGNDLHEIQVENNIYDPEDDDHLPDDDL